MGCDIHLFAEIRKDGKWVAAGSEGDVYDGRNYDLFAILADVRNGIGFAGCITGAGFNPIDDPRGIPSDASDEYQSACSDWDGDAHSHSYFTLAELKSYDWQQTTTHSGWVTPEEFKVFLEKGKPSSWCGDVSGGAVKKISPADMQLVIAGKLEVTSGFSYYTQVVWQETYADSAENFLSRGMARLEALKAVDQLPAIETAHAEYLDEEARKALQAPEASASDQLPAVIRSDDVRIVFFFDN